MKQKSYSYCLDLTKVKLRKSKALSNLVMALASNEGAQSVTELSLSPVYHYQYSSLCDAISDLATSEEEYLSALELTQGFVWSYSEEDPTEPLLLHTDVTPLPKRYSPTLADRSHIVVPNEPIADNKPLDIGYDISCVNVGLGTQGWSIPLDMRRVSLSETAADLALTQLKHLQDHPSLGLTGRPIINALDSGYGSAAYLSRAYQFEHMTQVVRLRHGRTVWEAYAKWGNLAETEVSPPAAISPKTPGRSRSFGQAYSLIEHSQWKQYKKHPKTGQPYQKYHRSIYELPADEQHILSAQTGKGRALEIHLHRWKEMLLRTKRGFQMADKPFDLMACRVLDAQTKEKVFEQDMFLSIFGQNRKALSTPNAYQAYRSRTDIEGYFRLGKQRLLLHKYQTPVRQHLDNWLICQIFVAWLLYVLRNEAQFIPRKWEKYLPKYQEQQAPEQQKVKPLSMTQAQRAALALFLTFDSNPFRPQKSKKGRPRQVGDKQIPRQTYSVAKKTAKWSYHQYHQP